MVSHAWQQVRSFFTNHMLFLLTFPLWIVAFTILILLIDNLSNIPECRRNRNEPQRQEVR